MGDQRDGMLKLMEKLKKEDVFMSLRPDSMFYGGDNMVVTFRKTGASAVPYHQATRFSFTELRALNIGIEDLLIDMVDKFIRDFNKEEEKHYASKRPNKE